MTGSMRRALRQAQAPYCGWLKLNILNSFLLKCSCFTMLCYFQLYLKANQLCVYTRPLCLDFLSILVTAEL